MSSDDFTKDLIKSLNKEHGSRVAYNLSEDESPTHVKRWISTGSTMLDYICANRVNGGFFFIHSPKVNFWRSVLIVSQ